MPRSGLKSAGRAPRDGLGDGTAQAGSGRGDGVADHRLASTPAAAGGRWPLWADGGGGITWKRRASRPGTLMGGVSGMRGMASAGACLLATGLVVVAPASVPGGEPGVSAAGPSAAAAGATPPVVYSMTVLAASSTDEGLSLNNAGQVAGTRITRHGARAFVWSPGAGRRGLGLAPGAEAAFAVAINDKGQVAGNLSMPGGGKAFLWDPAAGMRVLALPGALRTDARDVNNQGQVIGSAATADRHAHAFLWDPVAGMRDLGTLPGGLNSGAVDINDQGQVVGTADLPAPAGSMGDQHAALWDPATGIRDLGTLPGGEVSLAVAINEAGQVAGYSEGPNGPSRASVWDPATGLRALGTLPGGDDSWAFDINNSGQVAGNASTGHNPHAFLWDPGTGMRDLGTLPALTGIFASDVNNAGQVVGRAVTRKGYDRAFLWDPGTGMRSLGALGSGQSSAVAVNEGGQIAGVSTRTRHGGTTSAVLWSPKVLSVIVRAVAHGGKLHVNVNPNLGTGSWTLRVQRLKADGTWRTLKKGYHTKGRAETRTINLPRGTYRVWVNPEDHSPGVTSTQVYLRR